MQKSSWVSGSFKGILGGSLMVSGAVPLMILPLITGSNPIPESILLFGLVSILGGWALTLAGIEPPQPDAQSALND